MKPCLINNDCSRDEYIFFIQTLLCVAVCGISFKTPILCLPQIQLAHFKLTALDFNNGCLPQGEV